MNFINIYIMILVLFSLSYLSIIYVDIQVCITCISNYTKNPNHKFLASRWVVHNYFMDLGNPSEDVVHYFLIRKMIFHGHWVEFPIVSALVCMVTHWVGPMVSHDISYRVVMTSSSYYVAWDLNFERTLS